MLRMPVYRRLAKSCRGASLIYFVIWLLLVNMVLIYLLTDVGRWLVTKHEIEACTDAAVLAGASCFRLSYPVDANGIPIIDDSLTEVTIDKDAAEAASNELFDSNLTLKGFKGITIVDRQGKVTTSRWGNPEYSYMAKISVKSFFLPTIPIKAISRAEITR